MRDACFFLGVSVAVATALVGLFGIALVLEETLRQQAIDMQESRPHAVIQKDNGQ